MAAIAPALVTVLELPQHLDVAGQYAVNVLAGTSPLWRTPRLLEVTERDACPWGYSWYREGADGRLELWRYNWDSSG